MYLIERLELEYKWYPILRLLKICACKGWRQKSEAELEAEVEAEAESADR